MCLNNNPLIFTDPDGDFAIVDDAVVGFFKGLFSKRTNFDKAGSSRIGNAFRSAGRHAKNSVKIYGGLFTTDKDGSFFGQTLELISRFTYQLPQTAIGFLSSHGTNMFSQVSDVNYHSGATVVRTRNQVGGWGGFTLGSFIVGDKYIMADPKNELFQHEYGHYLQSQTWGPAYILGIGIPSVISASRNSYSGHNAKWFEQGANIRSINYFLKTEKNFWKNDWDFNLNPIIDQNQIFIPQSKKPKLNLPKMTNIQRPLCNRPQAPTLKTGSINKQWDMIMGIRVRIIIMPTPQKLKLPVKNK